MNRLVTLLAVTAAAVLAGCTTKQAHHIPPRDSIAGGKNYKMAFVEYHEDGYAQKVPQLAKALRLIKTTEKPLVIAYVHGWHHNSTSADVGRFRQFLEEVANTPVVRQRQRNVVGVYVGWRGESLDANIWNTFTYWSRERAGRRLALGHAPSKPEMKLKYAINEMGRAVRARGADCHSILLGHSFGGLVLEESINESIRKALEDGSEDAIAWDLAVTLNCANRSTRSRALLEALDKTFEYRKERDGFVARQNPSIYIPKHRTVMVAVGAENDRATGFALPIGNWIGSVAKLQIFGFFDNEALRDNDDKPVSWFKRRKIPYEGTRTAWEGEFATSSVTNNRDLINTHVVGIDLEDPSQTPARYRDSSALERNVDRNLEGDVFYTRVKPLAASTRKGGTSRTSMDKEISSEDRWKRWKFEVTDNRRSLYPVIRVPKEIIDDHGGIWSAESVALLGALYRKQIPLAAAPSRPAPSVRAPASVRSFVPAAAPGPIRIPKNEEAAAAIQRSVEAL